VNKSMTLEEFANRRTKLRVDIGKLLDAFYSETGAAVESVSIELCHVLGPGETISGNAVNEHVVDIRLDI